MKRKRIDDCWHGSNINEIDSAEIRQTFQDANTGKIIAFEDGSFNTIEMPGFDENKKLELLHKIDQFGIDGIFIDYNCLMATKNTNITKDLFFYKRQKTNISEYQTEFSMALKDGSDYSKLKINYKSPLKTELESINTLPENERQQQAKIVLTKYSIVEERKRCVIL